MDIECSAHPTAPVTYLRIVPAYRVYDWRNSVQFVCDECHLALMRLKAMRPAKQLRAHAA